MGLYATLPLRVGPERVAEHESNVNKKWSGRRGSNSQLSAWESKFPLLYFHNLQNRSGKINVHASHTVHPVPDLRVAAGRLGDVLSD